MADGLLVNLLLGLQKDSTMNQVSQLFDLIYENSEEIIWHIQTPENPGKFGPLM